MGKDAQDKSYALAKDSELDGALAYLSTHDQHKSVSVDRFMLQTIFNAVSQQREPKSKLALLTATVTRKHIAAKDKGNVRIVEAYISGVMKMFSIRSVYAKQRQSTPTTVSPATGHPVEKNGQFVLL